jgi:hypothetical protein
MATLYSSKNIRALTIGGFEIPDTAAGTRFYVPDDLAGEVQRILQQRSDSPTVTIEGYDRVNRNFVSPYDPRIATTAASQTANAAFLTAFWVGIETTVTSAIFSVGASSGNCDVGIYDNAGTLLASTGSVAPGTSIETWPLNTSVTLYPGVKYWAAIAADNNTMTFHGVACTATAVAASPLVAAHVSVATSFPLPATITIGSTVGGRMPLTVFV